MVWGRARAGPRGQDYCGITEALLESSAVTVARSLASVRQGRVPVRIRNLSEFSLTPDADGVLEVGVVETSRETGQDPADLKELTEHSDLTAEQQGKLTALLQKWESFFH